MTALSPPLTIRLLRAAELPALEWDGEYAHFRSVFGEAFAEMEAGRALIWVAAEPGGALVGQVFVQLESRRKTIWGAARRAYLYSIRVKAEYRNAGIGTALMGYVEKDLRKRGYVVAALNVAKDNPDGQRFYERCGYRVVGDDPGQWSYLDHLGARREVDEPSWRMEKRL